MSENHTDCDRFEAGLLEGATTSVLDAWQPHLEACADCRQQWRTHQMLVATFAQEAVPELSPAFDAGLQRKIDSAIETKPLKGWRLVAMAGYAVIAALLLRWVFTRFPLPSIFIDSTSPWTVALAIAAVPLTLWMTIAATRWLPSRRGGNLTYLGLL